MDNRIQKWADLLINYSIKGQTDTLEDKMILVAGEISAEPLMLALNDEIVKAGAHARLEPRFPSSGLSEILYGTDKHLSFISKTTSELFNEAQGFIIIKGAEEPYMFRPYTEQQSIRQKAFKNLQKIRLAKPWVITQYPTKSESLLEGFNSYTDFKDFVIASSVADYGKMESSQKEIQQMMQEADCVTLLTYDPIRDTLHELNLDIKDQIPINSHGLRNVPDGEVWTSPRKKYSQGEVFLDVPIMRNGHIISGVYLNYTDGKLVDFDAQQGYDKLKSIVEIDEGGKGLGEIAIATNAQMADLMDQYGVTLTSILFIEKLGGTIHMALGNSNEKCYSQLVDCPDKEATLDFLIKDGLYNQCADHLDIPKSYRKPHPNEALFIGNTELVWKKDRWIY